MTATRWCTAFLVGSILLVVVGGATRSARSSAPDVAAGARAAAATPIATGAAAGSLAALLARVPDPATWSGGTDQVLAVYANPAAEFASLGMTPPASILDVDDLSRHYFAESVSWPLGSLGIDIGFDDAWRQAYGFDLFLVDQALQVPSPDGAVTLVRGRFDAPMLMASWRQTYADSTVTDGITVYSDGPEPLFRSAAQLGDGTLLFAAHPDAMRAALDVAAGRATGLGARPDVAALLRSMPTDLAGALLLDGAGLNLMPELPDRLERLLSVAGGTEPAEAAIATAVVATATAVAATGTMPPVRLALLATTPGDFLGGPPWQTPAATPRPEQLARSEVALLVDDRAAAEQARDVVATRLDTLRSLSLYPLTFAELYAEREVWVTADHPIVRVRLGGAILLSRDAVLRGDLLNDLLFLYW